LPVVADLADAGAAVDAVSAATAQLGTVSILVNNAAMPDAMFVTKMPLDLVDAVIHTNFRAPFVLASEVAKRLIAARRPGRIVNVSSMSSFYYGGEGAALYSMTKAAVNRMTEALAIEWAKFDINVNGIAPGAFDTEMMQGMVSRVGDLTEGYPRRRMGKPSQLDSTLLYLVDPRSEFVTGTVIKVDDAQLPR
jgi:NAD(P)-dependent dehydrogenase (short-subunit alcohol dehydrogenase family)